MGWPVAVVPDPPPGTLGLNSDTLGTAWQVFGASRYGLARFEVSAPMALPPANRFRLRFQPLEWRWQLVGLILPENIQNLLGMNSSKLCANAGKRAGIRAASVFIHASMPE